MVNWERFWTTFRENAVFLTLVLPVIGAILVAVSASWDALLARRTALVNALLTLILAILCVVHYDIDATWESGTPRPIQMMSSFPWLIRGPAIHATPESTSLPTERSPGPLRIRILTGVNAFGVWAFVVTAWLGFAALLTGVETASEAMPGYYVGNLWLQVSLLGVFAAQDVVLLTICWLAMGGTVFVLLGCWGRWNRPHAAIGGLMILTGSALLFGVAAMMGSSLQFLAMNEVGAVAEPTFTLQQLVNGLAIWSSGTNSELAITSMISWTKWPLWLSCGLLIGMVPLHWWWRRLMQSAPRGSGSLLLGALPLLGFTLLTQFVLPYQAMRFDGTVPWLLGSSAVLALLAVSAPTHPDAAGYVTLALMNLAAAAYATGTTSGMLGGQCLALCTALAGPAWWMARGRCGWIVMGLPGTGILVGEVLVMKGFLTDPSAGLMAALVGLGILIVILIAVCRPRTGWEEDSETSGVPSVQRFLIIPVVLIGVWPTVLLDRLAPSERKPEPDTAAMSPSPETEIPQP